MIDIKNTNTSELLSQANEIFDQTRPFAELMMRYKCAMLEVKTKLDVLNTQLSLENDRNPFESIACRLKSVPSIIEKLNRKGLELSAESIEKNLKCGKIYYNIYKRRFLRKYSYIMAFLQRFVQKERRGICRIYHHYQQ